MELLYWLEKRRTGLMDDLMLLITTLGEETVFMAVAIIIFWCVDKYKGYLILAVGFFGTLANQFMKMLFRVPRPWVCLVGGPPCPPYSQTRHYLVGKADGFDDEHAGFAVPEYFRAVEELKPKVFLFENVDGFSFKTHQQEFDFLKDKALLIR